MQVHYKTTSEDEIIVKFCDATDVMKTITLSAIEKVYALNPSARFVDGTMSTLSEDDGVFVFVWDRDKFSVKVHVTKSEVSQGYVWNSIYKSLELVFEIVAEKLEVIVIEDEETNEVRKELDYVLAEVHTNAQPDEKLTDELNKLLDSIKIQEPKLYTEKDLQEHKDKYAQVIAAIQEELKNLKAKIEASTSASTPTPKEDYVVITSEPKRSISKYSTITPILPGEIIRDLASFDRKKLKPPGTRSSRRRDKKRWNNNNIYENLPEIE